MFTFSDKAKLVLRKPLGIAIFKDEPEAVSNLKILAKCFSPPMIASVGDIVTLNVCRACINPSVAIVDFKSKRKNLSMKNRRELLSFFNECIYVRNPRSTITFEAWNKVHDAVRLYITKRRRTLIIVDGEEDLLTLAVSMAIPEKGFVIYGQPDEALIVVIVSKYIKKAFLNFLFKNNF